MTVEGEGDRTARLSFAELSVSTSFGERESLYARLKQMPHYLGLRM